jgi:hypothetical protein
MIPTWTFYGLAVPHDILGVDILRLAHRYTNQGEKDNQFNYAHCYKYVDESMPRVAWNWKKFTKC